MSEPKSKDPVAAEHQAHEHRDEKVDDQLEDTFPASDPLPTTPQAGTRKAEQVAAKDDPHGMKTGAHQADAAATPHDDRQASETAAARTSVPRD